MLRLVDTEDLECTVLPELEVKEVYQILQEVKPKRFNKENKYQLFNDPRITDFAFVELKVLWALIGTFKKTGINSVNFRVDYTNNTLNITSPDANFEYHINIQTEKR